MNPKINFKSMYTYFSYNVQPNYYDKNNTNNKLSGNINNNIQQFKLNKLITNNVVSSYKLVTLKLNIIFTSLDNPKKNSQLNNSKFNHKKFYINNSQVYSKIIFSTKLKNKSFVLQAAQTLILKALFSFYWTSNSLKDVHRLYGFNLNKFKSNLNKAISSKVTLLVYILSLAYYMGDPINVIKIKNSKIKTAYDLNSFKNKVFKNRLTWKHLNFKTSGSRFKPELFFLKNIFNDIAQSNYYKDTDFFYALISLLLYTNYIDNNVGSVSQNLKVEQQRRVLEFTALSFRLLVSQLITNYLSL